MAYVTGQPISEEAGPGQQGQSRAAAQAAGRPGFRARVGPALKRFLVPGILIAGGLGVMAVAFFAVYPKPEIPIPVPASPSLVIYTSGHVGQVSYVVTKDAAGLPAVRVTVSLGSGVLGGQLVPLPVPPQHTSSIEMTLPAGLAFRDCGGACKSYAGEVAWVQPLDFRSGLGIDQPGQATVVFPVAPAGFGVDVGSVYAYAAIPEVTFMSLTSPQVLQAGVNALVPSLRAEYPIAAAGNYDWSSGPVPTVTGPDATWQEILGTSDTPALTAAGVNHGRQGHDANWTFWAGLLIGLAGSVVLAGLQLLLPPPTPAPGKNRGDATAQS
jgi:hypothetical protein